MAAIYRATLDEIVRDDFRVLDQRISLPPLRKLWLAARPGSANEHSPRPPLKGGDAWFGR
jgi:phytoene/squalene synthetase